MSVLPCQLLAAGHGDPLSAVFRNNRTGSQSLPDRVSDVTRWHATAAPAQEERCPCCFLDTVTHAHTHTHTFFSPHQTLLLDASRSWHNIGDRREAEPIALLCLAAVRGSGITQSHHHVSQKLYYGVPGNSSLTHRMGLGCILRP